MIRMKKSPSKKDYPARCAWCSHGVMSADGAHVFCKKKGVMEADDRCRRYDYDPLRRIPRAQPTLSVPDEKEFRLS